MLLQEDLERERYEVYANQCLWTIAAGLYSLGGQTLSMPQYVELIHPEMKDTRTAQEIKDDIVKRLLEG